MVLVSMSLKREIQMFTYLNEGFCAFKEMLAPLGFRTFLVPIDNRLIREAVLVVQDLIRYGIKAFFC